MSQDILVILLNGPMGIGKSTLGEVLGELIEHSVSLDGDGLLALNPPPADEIASLHATLALLVDHHLAQGYQRFIINHYWSSAEDIADLQRRLDGIASKVRVHCFRLTVSEEENLRRIMLRRRARAIDETEFEDRHFAEEHAHLSRANGNELGVPFDASGRPESLAARMLTLIALPTSPVRS